MHLSLTDFVILALIILLIYSGRWFDDFGRKMGEAIRHFKGNGPGGPKAA